MNRLPLYASALSLLTLLPLAAQTPAAKETAPPAAGDKDAKPEAPAKPDNTPGKPLPGLEKLSAEQQKILLAGMGEVNNYIRGVRQQEALAKLLELEEKVGENHYISNLRGAVYTRIKNYKVARVHFQKALELAKGLDSESFHPKFNLAELDFVEAGNASAKVRRVAAGDSDFTAEEKAAIPSPEAITKLWNSARENFSKLLTDPGKPAADSDTLIKFKLLICDVEQKKDADLEKQINAFDQYDQNSPAYYYAQAARCFGKDDKEGANEWLDSARKIYPKDMNEVYDDSFVEMGWLETLQ